MHPFLQGAILGLTLSVLLGPALFTLLQTSIHRGLKSGLFLAGGIFLSDLSVVYLAFLGALQLINQKNTYVIAGVIGGLILIGFGIYTFRRKVHIDENNNLIEIKVPGPITYILKGYFLNIMNPFVWFFWISAMVGVSANYGDDKHGVMIFFAGTLAAILGSDIFKVFLANKLKQYLKPQMLIRVNHIVGILLVVFGVFLIIRVFIQI
ncbi:MAG: LysE family transporter [Bacteroidales bacterium]|nr:LysE family transporter [Bacteroidales bacterium]